MPLSGQLPRREVLPRAASGAHSDSGKTRRAHPGFLEIRISEVCRWVLGVSLTILESWLAAHDPPPARRGQRIGRKGVAQVRRVPTKRTPTSDGIPAQLVTVDEAAGLLACTPAAIRKWLAQRRLGRVKVGRLTRLRLEDIQRVSIEGLPKKGSARLRASTPDVCPE
jgi:excisionase family DNA binding protein